MLSFSFCLILASLVPSMAMSTNDMALLSGNYSDHGIDADGDGKYDFLTVTAEVFVRMPEEYSLTGVLFDKNNQEIVWSIDHEKLVPGPQKMKLDFDGKALRIHGVDGPYKLKNVILSMGTSESNIYVLNRSSDAYQTSYYSFNDFVSPARTEKILRGRGWGEALLTINITKTVQVFSNKYSLDLANINIPPFSSPFKVIGSDQGYAFDAKGVYMPPKPNNFTVKATGVKDLNVGLRKNQNGTYRSWISSQISANEEGIARADTNLISPSPYHAKIFGKAAENTSIVKLEMAMQKKVVIDGSFNLCINTSGFPEGEYTISMQAQNGTLRLSQLTISGLNM